MFKKPVRASSILHANEWSRNLESLIPGKKISQRLWVSKAGCKTAWAELEEWMEAGGGGIWYRRHRWEVWSAES